MFGSNKNGKPQNRIDSLIGEGVTIDGNVTFTGGLRVDGEIRGNVASAKDENCVLVLSEKGRIEGEVRVSHLIVNGTVAGPVYCGELLELQPKAKVSGDVEYNTLEMHPGAIVQGRLAHQSANKTVELKLASNAGA